MCGILCCIYPSRPSDETGQSGSERRGTGCPFCSHESKKSAMLLSFLHSRGPDGFYNHTITKCDLVNLYPPFLPLSSGEDGRRVTEQMITIVHLSGHVLWTQGFKGPLYQPYTDATDPYNFLFNGDLYNYFDNPNELPEVNDSLTFFQEFGRAVSLVHERHVLKVISKLKGPFAFIFYDNRLNIIWFGRDFFGRESLILAYDNDSPPIFLCSVSGLFGNVIEIPTAGIFRYSIDHARITLFPWNCHPRTQILQNVEALEKNLKKRNISMDISPQLIDCFSTVLKSVDDSNQNILKKLMEIPLTSPAEMLTQATTILDSYINEFLIHFRRSILRRVGTQPPHCKDCISKRTTCSHSKIAVLFSGGIDSLAVAYLTAECLHPGESMDLLNVAFHQDLEHLDPTNIPDRQTALAAYPIIKSKFPQVIINFIPIDITKHQVEEMRQLRIRHLLSPLTSVLDDSIGCCLWFAAQGNNQSPARVLLVGQGADELFGGYSRHRSAYQEGGWSRLREEMQFDLDRISERNMGRDNRILSDHGVAPRMPFLDEGVVQYLTNQCDVWVKCCPIPGFNRGMGEKLLLRATILKLIGQEGIELALVAKRAMQFGSRIAKLENTKEKGHDLCNRLANLSLKYENVDDDEVIILS